MSLKDSHDAYRSNNRKGGDDQINQLSYNQYQFNFYYNWLQLKALVHHYYDYFIAADRSTHMDFVHINSDHELTYFMKKLLKSSNIGACNESVEFAKKHIYAAVRAPN